MIHLKTAIESRNDTGSLVVVCSDIIGTNVSRCDRMFLSSAIQSDSRFDLPFRDLQGYIREKKCPRPAHRHKTPNIYFNRLIGLPHLCYALKHLKGVFSIPSKSEGEKSCISGYNLSNYLLRCTCA